MPENTPRQRYHHPEFDITLYWVFEELEFLVWRGESELEKERRELRERCIAKYGCPPIKVGEEKSWKRKGRRDAATPHQDEI